MTARADVIARITDRVQFLTAAAPGAIAHDRPLVGQEDIDSLDLAEIEFHVEGEFGIPQLDLPADCTIDSIADAVIAARM